MQAGLAPHFGIRWPDPGHAQSCPAYTDKPRPQAPKTWPHEAADDAELHTMAQCLERFERLGFDWLEAGHLADRLLVRDREGDDRRLCLECHHLQGRPGAWRCSALRGMAEPLVATLQRCPALRVAS